MIRAGIPSMREVLSLKGRCSMQIQDSSDLTAGGFTTVHRFQKTTDGSTCARERNARILRKLVCTGGAAHLLQIPDSSGSGVLLQHLIVVARINQCW